MEHPAENPVFTSEKWPLVVVPMTQSSRATWAYYISETKVLVGHVAVTYTRAGVKKLTCKCDGLWLHQKYLTGQWKLIETAYLTDIGIRATKVGQEIKKQSGC